MAELTPFQRRTRERVESVIRLMAPAMTLVLAVGDRISRFVAPEDYEYYPARPLAEREPASGEGQGGSLDRQPDKG